MHINYILAIVTIGTFQQYFSLYISKLVLSILINSLGINDILTSNYQQNLSLYEISAKTKISKSFSLFYFLNFDVVA